MNTCSMLWKHMVTLRRRQTVPNRVIHCVHAAAHLVHGRRVLVFWLDDDVRDHWLAQRLVLQQVFQINLAQLQPGDEVRSGTITCVRQVLHR